MKYLKLLVFSMFALSSSCSSKKEISTVLPEAIKEVYFRKWIGGQESSGSGTNLNLQFEVPLGQDIYLQKAYFQSQQADFDKENETTYIAHFYAKSISEDLILDGDSDKEYGNKPPQNKMEMPDFPYDLKPTEAVLEFNINNKVKHVKITNIKEKELIAYPSMDREKN